jgi:biotin operon repressor
MLFGVKAEGQLGGRNEMIDAFELFQNTYTSIRQSMVEGVVNFFADLFGVTATLELKRVQAVQRDIPDATLQRVYDSYPVDQLAEMAGLPKAKKSLPVQMEAEDEIYEVLWEREFKGQTDAECLSDFNSMRFDKELTANQRAIIDLLAKDPLMPSEGIAKAIGSTTSEVNKMIDELRDGGYLGKTKPTKKGEKVVDDEGSKTDLFEIRYKYDWRPNVAPDNNARDFCDSMLRKTARQSGWMTRMEIEGLNNGQGLGVWESRGGFWNRNGVAVPFCRHIWKQMVVKKKR